MDFLELDLNFHFTKNYQKIFKTRECSPIGANVYICAKSGKKSSSLKKFFFSFWWTSETLLSVPLVAKGTHVPFTMVLVASFAIFTKILSQWTSSIKMSQCLLTKNLANVCIPLSLTFKSLDKKLNFKSTWLANPFWNRYRGVQ